MKLVDIPPSPASKFEEPAWQTWMRQMWQAVTTGLSANANSQTLGTATLVAGTKVVTTNRITANSLVFYAYQSTSNPGILRTSARVVGTSFTILSSNGADTSTVAWVIVEPL